MASAEELLTLAAVIVLLIDEAQNWKLPIFVNECSSLFDARKAIV